MSKTKKPVKDLKDKEIVKKDFRPAKGKEWKLCGNDFNWWNQFPDLMKTAVALPFNFIPGRQLFSNPDSTSLEEKLNRVAGIVAHKYVNTYGSSFEATDGANMTFRKLWLAMHRKYRGIGTYEAADLGIIQIASIEVISLICELERIYGILNHYDVMNRNLPYTLLQGLGVSPTLADNLRANLADFRLGLNVLLERAQTMCVFKDMPLVYDKISLASNVYKDRDTVDAQFIVYTLQDCGIYYGDVTPTGGSVEFMNNPMSTSIFANDTTYDTVLTKLKFRLDQLLSDEDVQRVYSDMLAAFGADKLLFIRPLPEDYKVYPVYDNSILHKEVNCHILPTMVDITAEEENAVLGEQNNVLCSIIPTTMYNASGWASGADKTAFRISQYDNVINTRYGFVYNLSNSTISVTSGIFNGYTTKADYNEEAGAPVVRENVGESLLNTFTEPNDAITCEGVLWKFFIREDTFGEGYRIHEILSGPELLVSADYYTLVAEKGAVTLQVTSRKTSQFIPKIGTTNPDLDDALSFAYYTADKLRAWALFDWQYQLYMTAFSTSMGSLSTDLRRSNIGEIDNVRVVTSKDVLPIHRVAFMSGFNLNVNLGAE